MPNFTRMEANKDWADVQYTITYRRDIIINNSWDDTEPQFSIF